MTNNHQQKIFPKNSDFGRSEITGKVSIISQKSRTNRKHSFPNCGEDHNLGSSAVFFNTCFDKTTLKSLIAWFLKQYGQKPTVDLVESFKQIGFHQATSAGVSLGIEDLAIPPQKGYFLSQASLTSQEVNEASQTGNLTRVEKSQRLIDTWNQTSETLRHSAVHNFRVTNPVNPVYMMAFSGARGNISQVRQLVAMRGLMADPQGAILEFPIQSNFREGLTVTEYLISCFGARKGIVDTALRTATSGYLTRRLVEAVQHVVVVVPDCHTTRGIVLKRSTLEQKIVGRVLLEDLKTDSFVIKKNTLISVRLAKQIASFHTEVRVRSPLTCQTERSVCQLCYGLDLGQGKLVTLGEAVGIIAAQSIGEPGTQLTMRTFHTGGVGVFSEHAMKIVTAPFDGQVYFSVPLPGRFVRTPHGSIVYMLKHKMRGENQILLRLIPIDEKNDKSVTSLFWNKKGKDGFGSKTGVKENLEDLYKSVSGPTGFDIFFGDVPTGSLIWVKQGELIKSGQLLIQSPRSLLQAKPQEKTETTHPILSPLSGEVFFENMRTRLEEKIKKVKIQKKQADKEVSPIFEKLIKLGTFWVFSSYIQIESQAEKSFFRKGDLVSPTTPLYQYDSRIPLRGQLFFLQNFNKKQSSQKSSFFGTSSLCLGFRSFQLSVTKLHYSQPFYFLTFKGQNRKPQVFTYSKTVTNTFLTWYPSVVRAFPLFLGYTSIGFSNPQREFFWTYSRVLEIKKRILRFLFLKENQLFIFFPRKQLLQFPIFETKNGQVRIECCSLFSTKKGNEAFASKKSDLFYKLTKLGIIRAKRNPFICFPFFLNQKRKTICLTNRFMQEFPYQIGFSSAQIKNQQQSHSSSHFLLKAQKNAEHILSNNDKFYYFQNQNTWLYIPEINSSNQVSTQKTRSYLGLGKAFEKVRFANSSVSLSIISNHNFSFLQRKKYVSVFYSISELLQKIYDVGNEVNPDKKNLALQRLSFFSLNSKIMKRIESITEKEPDINKNLLSQGFCFYRNQNKKLRFLLQTKKRNSHILVFQRNKYSVIPEVKLLKEQWLDDIQNSPISSSQKSSFFGTSSSLFTKQTKTFFSPNFKITFEIEPLAIFYSQWTISNRSFPLQIQFTGSKPLLFSTWNNFGENPHKQIGMKSLSYLSQEQSRFFLNKIGKEKLTSKFQLPLFKILFYDSLELHRNLKNLCFQTLSDGWILPEWPLTKTSGTFSKLAEFQGFRYQEKKSVINLSLIQKKDLNTFSTASLFSSRFFKRKNGKEKNTNQKMPRIRTKVRWGSEFGLDWAIPQSGLIIKKTEKRITVRKGIPFLVSKGGFVHISHKEFVQKEKLLVTLKSQRLQTEDIIQGIPKIEQLFEARETRGGELIPNNMHQLLRRFFVRALKVLSLPEAVNVSFTYIQKFLVENILEAYSSQGVTIAEKHVEIVVRQMTTKVRILSGGETGYLSGELVSHRFLENVNEKVQEEGRCPAIYEPVVLGITKSVLQSESFLLAASFQQVSKVLVRSALAKKTDFLRGLHENLLVGQVIPVGTGSIKAVQPKSLKQILEEKNSRPNKNEKATEV